MGRKPKFRPVVTRIKLNPEQAVLACTCVTAGYQTYAHNMRYTDLFNPSFEVCGRFPGNPRGIGIDVTCVAAGAGRTLVAASSGVS